MKRNKLTTRTKDEYTISNELGGEQKGDASKVTTVPKSIADQNYHDHTDHSREEQQVGLLASELIEEREDTKTIRTRLSALVPNILVMSHRQKSFDGNSVSVESRNTTTATKAMEKMLRNGDNKSNRQSGDVVDLESNEKTNKKFSSKTICFVLLLMAITIIATIVVFICHSPRVLDDEDRCLNQNGPFHVYKLLSTKTLYSTALNYLNKSPVPMSLSSTSSNPHDHNNQLNDNYDKSSIEIPKIFSSQDTLESIHKRLTIQEKCKLVQFHYYGRHAARTPDAGEIAEINKHISDVKSRIDLSKFKLEPQSDQQVQSQSSSPRVIKTQDGNSSRVECHHPLVRLSQWNDFVTPDRGNMVTEFGFQESAAIAQRLKNIFPEIFDGNQTSIKFGTTDELRTAQTAISFLKQMVNPPKVPCESDQFPPVNTLDKMKAKEIREDKCLKEFISTYKLDKLKFHKTCKSYKRGPPIGYNFRLNDPARTEFIAKSVSNELKLSGQNMLTSEEVRAVYDVCRYESAQLGFTSIWCRLFKDTDLMFYEYLSDISDFYNDAYGNANIAKSACPVTKDLLESFNNYLSKRRTNPKPEAYFHFTHSSVIQRMIAASVDLESDPAYESENVQHNLATGRVPQDRQWRTSLLSPFSANIAFTVYDCSKPLVPIARESSQGIVFDVSPLNVVASLNEQPILLTGCSDYVCDKNTLIVDGRLFGEKKCDLQSICAMNYVVT